MSYVTSTIGTRRFSPLRTPSLLAQHSVSQSHNDFRSRLRITISAATTSTYVERISAEQAAVEARLIELDGMETIQTGLKNTSIRGEDDMIVDSPPEPPTSRTIEAKRKALSRFVCLVSRVFALSCVFIRTNATRPHRTVQSIPGLSVCRRPLNSNNKPMREMRNEDNRLWKESSAWECHLARSL